MAAELQLALTGKLSVRQRGASWRVCAAEHLQIAHGLFADGSCLSGVIARLLMAGLNVPSVQNPLSTLPEAVASTERVLAWQGGPCDSLE
jgi:hypothetical protein